MSDTLLRHETESAPAHCGCKCRKPMFTPRQRRRLLIAFAAMSIAALVVVFNS